MLYKLTIAMIFLVGQLGVYFWLLYELLKTTRLNRELHADLELAHKLIERRRPLTRKLELIKKGEE